MDKIAIILVGPPGSGKSTLARQHCLFNYINQDLQGKNHFNFFNTAIQNNENIIVDRMNFSKGQRSRYLDVLKKNGYITEIIVLHENYDTCLNRMKLRLEHPTIKDELTAKKVLNFFFRNYERVSDDEADKVTRLWNDREKRRAIISDLDGTLCNVFHRRHFVQREGKKDWKSFFENIPLDIPNEWCADILRRFQSTHEIVYCTGRPLDYLGHTEYWLKDYGLYDLCNGHLYMRHSGDGRPDSVVKEIILDFELLSRFEPYFFIDDRRQVVEMYRARGFTCLSCDFGEF